MNIDRAGGAFTEIRAVSPSTANHNEFFTTTVENVASKDTTYMFVEKELEVTATTNQKCFDIERIRVHAVVMLWTNIMTWSHRFLLQLCLVAHPHA